MAVRAVAWSVEMEVLPLREDQRVAVAARRQMEERLAQDAMAMVRLAASAKGARGVPETAPEVAGAAVIMAAEEVADARGALAAEGAPVIRVVRAQSILRDTRLGTEKS
jgi:hypothetical protein